MIRRRAVAAASLTLFVLLLAPALGASDARAPYVSLPHAGDTVRLDGTLGGAKTAWAYVDRRWLEQYLQVTIDAAAANRPYGDAAVQNQLNALADHVTVVPNGTKASIESVASFSYGGRQDVEARVMLEDGPMRGRELWTTCAELVDSAGHSYLRM